MRTTTQTLPVLLLSLLLGGCSASVVPANLAPTEQKVTPASLTASSEPSFRPGERFELGVWLHGLAVGRVTAEAEAACGPAERSALALKASARTVGPVSGFKDARLEVRTLLELGSGAPLATRWRQETDKPVRIETQFLPDRLWAVTHRPGKASKPREQRLPGTVHDVQSVAGLLRNWRAGEGKNGHFFMMLGRFPWRVEVWQRPVEAITTELGEHRAVRIDGVAQRVRGNLELSPKTTSFALWVSDDAQRLPLRLVLAAEDGEIQAELLSYRAPAASTTRAATVGSAVATPPSASQARATAGPAAPEPRPPVWTTVFPQGCPAEFEPGQELRVAMAEAEQRAARDAQRAAQAKARRAQRERLAKARAAAGGRVDRAKLGPQQCSWPAAGMSRPRKPALPAVPPPHPWCPDSAPPPALPTATPAAAAPSVGTKDDPYP